MRFSSAPLHLQRDGARVPQSPCVRCAGRGFQGETIDSFFFSFSLFVIFHCFHSVAFFLLFLLLVLCLFLFRSVFSSFPFCLSFFVFVLFCFLSLFSVFWFSFFALFTSCGSSGPGIVLRTVKFDGVRSTAFISLFSLYQKEKGGKSYGKAMAKLWQQLRENIVAISLRGASQRNLG